MLLTSRSSSKLKHFVSSYTFTIKRAFWEFVLTARARNNEQKLHSHSHQELYKNTWLYVLMTRIWTYVTNVPVADRVGSLIPILKKTNSTSIDTTHQICLLTSTYKLYAILVFRKVRDRIKEYESSLYTSTRKLRLSLRR